MIESVKFFQFLGGFIATWSIQGHGPGTETNGLVLRYNFHSCIHWRLTLCTVDDRSVIRYLCIQYLYIPFDEQMVCLAGHSDCPYTLKELFCPFWWIVRAQFHIFIGKTTNYLAFKETFTSSSSSFWRMVSSWFRSPVYLASPHEMSRDLWL